MGIQDLLTVLCVQEEFSYSYANTQKTTIKFFWFSDLFYCQLFEGGPGTPFDPAPLGLALHEAKGVKLVSIPVFIQQQTKKSVHY